jgi:hypothetical protein
MRTSAFLSMYIGRKGTRLQISIMAYLQNRALKFRKWTILENPKKPIGSPVLAPLD